LPKKVGGWGRGSAKSILAGERMGYMLRKPRKVRRPHIRVRRLSNGMLGNPKAEKTMME
jgi:hypothetical protein